MEQHDTSNSSWTSTLRIFMQKAVLGFMLFLSSFLCYADRTNISICIILMAEQYKWDNTYQGVILSSFFWGYLVTQILGGVLSEKIGGKVVLFCGVCIWSVFTLLTPLAAHASVMWHMSFILIITRIGMGIGEAVNYPSIHNLMASRIPPNEKSRWVTFISCGGEAGTVMTVLISPIIAIHVSWEAVFYIFGIAGIIWAFIFCIIIPENTPNYMKNTYQDLEREQNEENIPIFNKKSHDIMIDDNIESLQVPIQKSSKKLDCWNSTFVRIWRTPAVWAIIVAHTCYNFGWYIIISWLPKYFTSLGVPFESVGLWANLPYVTIVVFSNVAGFVADYMIYFLSTYCVGKKNGTAIELTRKIMQSISFFGVALFLSLVRFTKGSLWLSTLLICIAFACASFNRAGFWVNHIDIAPKHAGMLMGVTNTFATIPGIVGNLLTGWLLDISGGDWTIVFDMMIVVYLVGGVFFFLFARGNVLFT